MVTFGKSAYYSEKFSDLGCRNEVMREREFEDCEFARCSFVDCRWEKCKLIDCKFNECLLSAVILTDSRLVGLGFQQCKAIGLDWTKASHVQDLVFEGCKVDYANFRMLKMPRLRMVECEAREVDFTEADLREAVFTGSDLERSVFAKTNLTKADFRGARNYVVDVRNNTIKKAHFSMPEALALLGSLEVVID